MDNLDHDNLSVTDVIGVAASLRESIIVKAKRKKAQKISDAGGYSTLSAYQKSLIPIPAYAQTQAQTIAAATGQAASTVTEQLKNAPAIDASGSQVKKYLPYFGGALVIGLLIYLISKN